MADIKHLRNKVSGNIFFMSIESAHCLNFSGDLPVRGLPVRHGRHLRRVRRPRERRLRRPRRHLRRPRPLLRSTRPSIRSPQLRRTEILRKLISVRKYR